MSTPCDRAFDERFTSGALDSRLAWFHEPLRWEVDASRGVLVVEPRGETDFWQRTHYGFRADNGHFLGMEAGGDFIMTTQVRFHPVHQYDQAGLMVRISPECWLKTAVEYEPEGPARLGAVVTNAGYSDWSTQDYPFAQNELQLRIRREAADYIVEYAAPAGDEWTQMRMARLHEDRASLGVRCGLYACSPKAAGYKAEFKFLRLQPGRVGSSAP